MREEERGQAASWLGRVHTPERPFSAIAENFVHQKLSFREALILGSSMAMYESTGKKPKPNAIYNAVYDDLVAQIFRNNLHSTKKIDVKEIRILFARRAKSVRHEALRVALDKAKQSFEAKWGKRSFPPITIDSAYPSESAGLQVVDYYLWAMQRMYETGQERFYRAKHTRKWTCSAPHL